MAHARSFAARLMVDTSSRALVASATSDVDTDADATGSTSTSTRSSGMEMRRWDRAVRAVGARMVASQDAGSGDDVRTASGGQADVQMVAV